MVNLELYKVFYTVAKCKSITKAAEELYISQPAVSHAIKQLETELGGKLFNRVSRGMELTDPGGKQMFEAVEKAMTTLDDAEKNFSSIKAVATGQVKIAASDNVINYFLINKIKRFRTMYPKVGLKFINATSRSCAELVKSGRADIGFVDLPIDSVGVDFVGQTGKIHDIFVASAAFDYLFDKEIEFDKISAYPLLFLDPTTRTRKKTEEFAKNMGVKLDPTIELASIELIVDMAVEGMGIACVPREYVKKQLSSGELKELNVRPSFPVREIGVICGTKKQRSYALQLFLNIVSETND